MADWFGYGQILAIIRSNGAGKPSLLNCMSGLYHLQAGSILFHNGATAAAFGVGAGAAKEGGGKCYSRRNE